MSVRYAVLGLISQKPRHGYETRVAFEALVGGYENWEVKPAQIYTTLDRLEEAGWVVCSSDLGEGEEPSRRVYRITPPGEAALQEWFSSGVFSGHQRDEFFIKLIIGLVSGRADPQRLIQTQRESEGAQGLSLVHTPGALCYLHSLAVHRACLPVAPCQPIVCRRRLGCGTLQHRLTVDRLKGH